MQAAQPRVHEPISDMPDGHTPVNTPIGAVGLHPPPTQPVANDATLLAELLAATAQGDRRAFARLYELTSGKLFAIALRILRQREAAEEVLQDTFLSIWQRAAQWRGPNSSPLGWMVTVVRHRAIDRLRKDRREPQESIVEGDELDAGADRDPGDLMLLDSMNGRIRRSLQRLPRDHRNAVLAAFYFGLTHDELSQRFDVPLGTAKSWVRRGLHQLRIYMDSSDLP